MRKTDLEVTKEFIETGKLHGTLIEAITWAIAAGITGSAGTVQEALAQAAFEWYK